MLGNSMTNLTASGQVSPSGVPAKLVGFYVNSTSSGTIVLRDGGSSGTAKSGTITPAIGFHWFPGEFTSDCYATLGGTINVTFFWAK